METSVHIDETTQNVTKTNIANLNVENNCNSKEKKISKYSFSKYSNSNKYSFQNIQSQVTPQRKWGDIYANYTWEHSTIGNETEYEETGLMS
ncbi:hypothetical protein CEXT_262121 [Caerostris extrusa]|uniref:Uncharacterized protein n=1 Tax=Caerostris extrusa TaxID=172846 RepID=A0AAV4Y6S6_CAEEX|nr:hypothetical protein CEXT_262121 [Caerostris extrusa]